MRQPPVGDEQAHALDRRRGRQDALRERPQARRLGLQLGERLLGGEREERRRARVLRARAQAALLTAAVVQRLELSVAAHDERADAVRPAELVARNAHERGAGVDEPQRHAAERAHGVEVQRHARARRCIRHRLDRLQRADLVARDEHRRDRRAAAADRLVERGGVGDSATVDPDPARLGALALEPLHRVERRVVLRDRHDDRAAVASAAPGSPPDALEGQVDGFGAAGGEDELGRVRPERRREPLARVLEHGSRPLPLAVRRRGIGERLRLGERAAHGFTHRRGRGVIELVHAPLA